MANLNEPHGGKLVDLMASPERTKELKEICLKLKSWDLTPRQMCDTELLLNGGFSPLTGFMGKQDYQSCLDNMKLASGTLWPMPITMDVSEEFASQVNEGDRVALRDPEGVAVAVLNVTDKWMPDKKEEAEKVFGKDDKAHPAVTFLHDHAGPMYLGGTLEGMSMPDYHSFKAHRHTPKELRGEFEKRNWEKIVAFQTRNPMHRAHYELTVRASKEQNANFLLNPVVGMTKPGDVDYYTRVRCYNAILDEYPAQSTMLSLLPLAMRMGGPREALWHAIIRKNYGCTHLIVGRDHAGPGNDSNGEPFYGPYDAQELLKNHGEELGITMVPFQLMSYVEDKGQYMVQSEIPEGSSPLTLSGTEFRRRLKEGADIPDWFSFPKVIKELRKAFPKRTKQGLTVFFTGLSGSGKSTVANALVAKLLELGDRPVTLLDGDIVRKNLSSELGFSKEHRDINILRIGFVASEITKNRGIAICAPIAPYAHTRKTNREIISDYGGYILVHISTPLEVCEKRDRKGLYAKARQGIIKEFTGISDPYEAPEDADLKIDTSNITPEAAAQKIMMHLKSEGYIQ